MSYASTILADSPVAYWRLGDATGTTAADSSGNALAGTYHGGFTLAEPGSLAGDSDTSVLFDGSTGYMEVPNNAAFDVTALTLECWAKVTSVPGSSSNPWIFGRADANSSNNGAFLFLFGSSGTAVADFKAGGTDKTIIGATSIVGGKWHHVAATLAGVTTGSAVKLYVDGAVDASGTIAADFAWAGEVVRAAISTNSFWQAFPGYLDELAWYGTALSSARILAHYQAGKAPIDPPRNDRIRIGVGVGF